MQLTLLLIYLHEIYIHTYIMIKISLYVNVSVIPLELRYKKQGNSIDLSATEESSIVHFYFFRNNMGIKMSTCFVLALLLSLGPIDGNF